MRKTRRGNYAHNWVDYHEGNTSGPATTHYRRVDILNEFGWKDVPPLSQLLDTGLTVADHILADVAPYRIVR